MGRRRKSSSKTDENGTPWTAAGEPEIYRLVVEALGIRNTSETTALLRKLSDAELDEHNEMAVKRAKLLMLGLQPLAVRVLKKILYEYLKGNNDAKSAGAAAAKILEYVRKDAPAVANFINRGFVVASGGGLGLPKPEAPERVEQLRSLAIETVAKAAGERGLRRIEPEDPKRRFPADAKYVENFEAAVAELPRQGGLERSAEVGLAPVVRFRDGE